VLVAMLRPSVALRYFGGGGAAEMMFSGKTTAHYDQL
jgi:hypothetical protein